MKKFKRIIRFQLRVVPALAIVVFMAGLIVQIIDNASYEELTEEQFTGEAIEHKIMDFEKKGREIRMTTPEGKYYHEFRGYDAEEQFEDTIQGLSPAIEDNGITVSYGPSYRYVQPIYLMVLQGSGSILLLIILLNVVILWFVTLFDLLKSEFAENHNKWLWFLSLLLLPFVSPFYYLFIAEKQKRIEGSAG